MNKLAAKREEMRMSQEELAEKSGVSRGTISALENGALTNSKLDTLQKLATTLESTVGDLFLP